MMMHPQPLTRAALDALVCSQPDRHFVYVRCPAHPQESDIEVRYEAGVLELTCAPCSEVFCLVAVAETVP